MAASPLLWMRGLNVAFPSAQGSLLAVSNLDLSLPAGAITCLVGESGSGKSLACKAVLRLEPEYAQLSGSIFFEGLDLLRLSEREMMRIRGAKIGMIFQEPMTSLNPVLTVGQQTAEPLWQHLGLGKKEARERVIELFRQVGIAEPEARYRAYPHLLSGGLRQRVMIAMAMSCGPSLLLADEPTTALDVTIQGQILRLIRAESRQRGMAVLLITHDLGVVAEVADYVGVIYAGSLMEYGGARAFFTNPLHPYTFGLMAAHPGCDSIFVERLAAIPGSVPTLQNIPRGCPFQPRCPRALSVCQRERPPRSHIRDHDVSCWLYC